MWILKYVEHIERATESIQNDKIWTCSEYVLPKNTQRKGGKGLRAVAASHSNTKEYISKWERSSVRYIQETSSSDMKLQ